MLFYPARRGNAPMFSSRLSTLRPLATAEAGDAMHLTWMLKSFIMGITLLGLSYWLVQIAGIQYFASLTSGTLLFFLLAYVVWCLLHRNRHSRQIPDGSSRMEAGHISPIPEAAEPLTPTPPPPFDQHQAYKFITTAPPRDISPPPSYDETMRAMMVMGASTPGDWHHTPASLDPVPEPPPRHQSANVAPPIPASITPRPHSSIRQPSSPSALSQSSAFTSSPQSALTSSPSSALALPSPSAITPEQESAPVIQTSSALTHQSASALGHPSQPTLTSQLSTALTQISQTALTTSSTVPCTLSQQPTQQMEEVS